MCGGLYWKFPTPVNETNPRTLTVRMFECARDLHSLFNFIKPVSLFLLNVLLIYKCMYFTDVRIFKFGLADFWVTVFEYTLWVILANWICTLIFIYLFTYLFFYLFIYLISSNRLFVYWGVFVFCFWDMAELIIIKMISITFAQHSKIMLNRNWLPD